MGPLPVTRVTRSGLVGTASDEPVKSDVPLVKRPRGRPRKYPLILDINGVLVANGPVAKKARLGRPPKDKANILGGGKQKLNSQKTRRSFSTSSESSFSRYVMISWSICIVFNVFCSGNTIICIYMRHFWCIR